jgi:predicted permease
LRKPKLIDRGLELVADGRAGASIAHLVREAGVALRVLRRSPALAALSVATMALGIGASAVVFALVHAIVLRPLPYPQPERLARIADTNRQAGVARTGVASGNVYEWRRRARAFSGIAGYYAMGRTLTTDAESSVVNAAQVSADFFPLVGVQALLGRTFTEEETSRATFNSAAAPTGPDPVAILSHALWRSRFGSDPGIVGRTIVLERAPFRVVGVMPPGFALPDRETQIWIPWEISAEHPRDQHYLGGIARLAEGRSIADGQHDLESVAADLAQVYPDTNRGWSVIVLPLQRDTVGTAANVLWLLMGAVGLLLVVASANVGLLSLIRGIERATDGAVRLALGATPSRVIREFLMESIVLAVLGGSLGVVLALAGVRLLPALVPDLPRLEEVTLDGFSMVFVVVVTVAASLLAGLPQAWRRTRLATVTALTDAPSRTVAGGHHATRDAMAVAQVALAVVLLVGSGLLVRTVRGLSSADSGFNPQSVLVAPIFLDSRAYPNGERSRAYYRALFDRLAQVPGVTAVGGATTVPTSPLGPDFERPVWPEGTTPSPAEQMPAAVRIVTAGYVEAMGLGIVEGRAIDDRDHPSAPRVLMVSQRLARLVWPGESPIGKQLVVDYSTAGTYPYEVIGVVGDVRFRGPRSEPLPEIYLAHAQRPYLILNVVVRTAGDPRLVMAGVQAALRDVDPQKPAHGLYPLEDLLGATYARDRQVMAVLAVFAIAATVLAVLGVYGVLSHRVRERAREIGIRMAMGAGTGGLVAWVVRAGARLVAIGLAAGLVVAWVCSAAISELLFGVTATDGVTIVGAISLLGVVAVAGTLVPAFRAARVDPMAILRRG